MPLPGSRTRKKPRIAEAQCLPPWYVGSLNMKQEYTDRLPQEIRSIAQRIERHIDSQIDVRVDNSRKNILACEINRRGAAILIPHHDYFPVASVLHELLHIHRVCVDSVPRVVVCDAYQYWTPKLESGLTTLDNNIEHFGIVPVEISYRPDRREYWKSRFRRKIQKPDQSNPEHIQAFDIIVYWSFLHIVLKEDDLIDQADEVISLLGVRDRAEEFQNEIIPHLDCKEKLVKVCTKHADIPVEAVCLKYIDCLHNSSYEVSLLDLEL